MIDKAAEDNVALFSNPGWRGSTWNGSTTAEQEKYISAIEGIGLIDPVIKGKNYVACFVDYFSGTLQYVKNCYAQNPTIEMLNGGQKGGGIAGEVNDGNNDLADSKSGIIENCYVSGGTLTFKYSGQSEIMIGGIVGGEHYKLDKCFSTMKIIVEDCPSDQDMGVSPIAYRQGSNSYIEDAFYLSGTIEPSTIKLNTGSYPQTAEEKAASEKADMESLIEAVTALTDDDGNQIFVENPKDPTGAPILASQLSSAVSSGSLVKLYIDKWNLVGSFGNVAQLNENTDGNDMAAVEFNYDENNWQNKYMHATDESKGSTKMTPGLGYFVWPFAYKPLTEEQNNNGSENGDEVTTNKSDKIGKYTYVPRNDSFVKDGDFTVSLINSNDPHWYALSNPYTKNIYVKPFADDNSLNGEYVYTYDVDKGWNYVAINAYVRYDTVVTVPYNQYNSWLEVTTTIKKVEFDGTKTTEEELSTTKVTRQVSDAEKGTTTTTSGTTYGSYIQPTQGFVISGQNASYTASFKSTHAKQTVENSSKVSSKSLAQPLEKMVFSSVANNTERKMLAAQTELASNGYDNGDSYVMLSTNRTDYVEPYFVVENKNLYSNRFKSLPYEAEINFHAAKQSETEFSVSNVPQDMDVYIVDLAKQTETLLSDGSTFTFTAEEGENEGRYKIKFINKKSGINDVTEADANVVSYDRNVSVSGTDLKSVKVVNMLGLQVYKANINSGTHRFDLEGAEAGTYVVVVETAKGTKSQKIIIK
ncbi:MAG: T9SS type A sorting domain-containing protein [Bacteroidales bacterium]|nr:T9SS type A sorting domain-containing protein [Bacteroidales bacterium]